MVSVETPLDDAELRQRAEALRELQRSCELCPRRCRTDRTSSVGFCHQPAGLHVAHSCAHRGEEPPLSGEGGAGTVFVAGCNLRCQFCQNHQISHRPARSAWARDPAELARDFLDLERQGCHNIEWVSPTQHVASLVEALRLARAQGLRLPVVYNSNGYERVSVLRLLEGIVDVYLPDAKYSRDVLAARLSSVSDYVEVNRRAILEMWRQVGPIQLDSRGLIRRGLLVRHLVLPGHLANTAEVLSWIGRALGSDAWVSLMAQYYPCHLSNEAARSARRVTFKEDKALERTLTRREYRRAVEALSAAGLENGWVQELSSGECFLPDFDRPDPFAPSAAGTRLEPG